MISEVFRGTLRHLDGLATVALARATRAAHRAGVTRADGASSATEWIKSATGLGGRGANRLARLGANLDDQPRTAEAVSRGDVPVESADAIVQAARDGRMPGCPTRSGPWSPPHATRSRSPTP